MIEKIKRKLKMRINRFKRSDFINSNEFTLKSNDSFFLIYNCFQKFEIKLRKTNSSDYNVFNQVFIQKEYEPTLSFFKSNNIKLDTMIDAGSNIGLTTIYFKNFYPNLKIACIEPDQNNFNLLKENTNFSENPNSVVLFNAGLLGVSGKSLEVTSSFRGGGDWAKQVELTNSKETNLKSVTIQDIMQKCDFNTLDLLKIDIEGAESFLIDKETNLDFLEKTKLISIEIHDEFNFRSQIYELFLQRNFLILDIGETTLAINKNYFNG